MSEAGVPWWLDHDRRWRRGTPPAGWTQERDGCWHAPGREPDRTTEELTVFATPWPDPPPTVLPTRAMATLPDLRLAGSGDTARHRRIGQPRGFSALPPWMKVAVPALAAVVVLMAAGLFLTVVGDSDRDLGAPTDELGAPAGTSNVTPPATDTAPAPTATDDGATEPAQATDADAAAGPTTSTEPPAASATTTPSRATPSTVPAPQAPGDPLAACSVGERNLIERGNHSWDWYLARFDEDGDGILCT